MTDQISPKRLAEYFAYDPDMGYITWRRGHGRTFAQAAGTRAFVTANSDGYLNGKFDRRTLKAHRVAWALHTGRWPVGQIDHINGDRTDNRADNLREVTHSENGKNRRLSANNTTGVNGVTYRQKYGSYVATIRVQRKRRHVGTFKSLAEASAALEAAKVEFGFHPNHGTAALAVRDEGMREGE